MWGPLPTLLNSFPFRYFFALTVGLNQRLPVFGMGELAVEGFGPSLSGQTASFPFLRPLDVNVISILEGYH